MGFAIGLTGGIASGKSTVARLFADLGVTVIDADLVAREVVLPGQVGLQRIVAEFGAQILDPEGRLNRKALRNIIFSDPSKKSRVDALLHPLIGERMLQRSNTAPGPYHILDIPLLVESDWRSRLQRILVVDCTPEIQLARLMQRDGESVEQAQRIINSQSSRQARLALADDVIDNNSTIEAVAQQVYRLHQCYLELAYEQRT